MEVDCNIYVIFIFKNNVNRVYFDLIWIVCLSEDEIVCMYVYICVIVFFCYVYIFGIILFVGL